MTSNRTGSAAVAEAHASVLLGAVTGLALFMLLRRYIGGGVQFYRRRFMEQVGTGLRHSFIRLDPRYLFLLNTAAAALAGGAVYLWAGPLLVPLAVAAVAAAPYPVISILHRRRVTRCIQQLPDALRSIASALRAGTSLGRALEQTVRQQAPPITQELAVVLSEYRMGRSLEGSLGGLQARLDRPEIALLSSALVVASGVGGNLADTLDSLADSIEEKLNMEGKIRSLTAMGRMQGWVVGILPLLVCAWLFLHDPLSMRPLITEPLGWGLLGMVTLMMALAVAMIRKIVNIDV